MYYDLTIFDLIRAVALGALVYATSSRSFEIWIVTDLVVSTYYTILPFILSLCGVNVMKSWVNQDTDSTHDALLRYSSLWLLAINVTIFLGRNSKDNTVIGSILWARIISIAIRIAIFVAAFSMYHGKFVERNMVADIMFTNVAWLAGSMHQMIKSSPGVGRQEFKGKSSLFFRINFLLMLACSVTTMAYPKWIFKIMGLKTRLDAIHMTLLRSHGAIVLMFAIFLWYAPSFRNIEDKRSVYCGIMTGIILDASYSAFAVTMKSVMMNLLVWAISICVPMVLCLSGLHFLHKEGAESKPHVFGRYNLRERNRD